jgi:hypothetical protein
VRRLPAGQAKVAGGSVDDEISKLRGQTPALGTSSYDRITETRWHD